MAPHCIYDILFIEELLIGGDWGDMIHGYVGYSM